MTLGVVVHVGRRLATGRTRPVRAGTCPAVVIVESAFAARHAIDPRPWPKHSHGSLVPGAWPDGHSSSSKPTEYGVRREPKAAANRRCRVAQGVSLCCYGDVCRAHSAYRLDPAFREKLRDCLAGDLEFMSDRVHTANLLIPRHQCVELHRPQLPGTVHHRGADRLRPTRLLRLVNQFLGSSADVARKFGIGVQQAHH